MEMKMKRYAAHTTKGRVATHKNSFPKRKKETTKLIPKVRSLGELRTLATASPSYLQLAICAAENLGGQVRQKENMEPGDTAYEIALRDAMGVLLLNANETGDERGVVAEVNFVRDCVK
jgi:hypothetical protein